MPISRERIEKTKKDIKKAKIVKNKEKARHKIGENLKSGVRKVVAGAALTALTAGLAPKASAGNTNSSSSDSFSVKNSKNITITPKEDADTLSLTNFSSKEKVSELRDKKKPVGAKKSARPSNSEEKVQQNIEQVGFDIRYSRGGDKRYPNGAWFIETKDGYNVIVPNCMNYDAIARDYMKRNRNPDPDFTPNLPLEYMYKLHMLKELKFNMSNGGMVLEQYEKGGSLSQLSDIFPEVNTLEWQKKLQKENDPEMRKKIFGEYFFNKWLEEYNVENSYYTKCAIERVWGKDVLPQQDFLWTYVSGGNAEFHQEYLRRVDGMFKEVPGLGDMRGVINPDFELNSRLSGHVYEMKTMSDLTKNCSTIDEAYQRIKGLLKVVKDCDANGVRTQEEQDLINKTILTLREKAEQEGKKTQEGKESSNQTILLQKQTHER